MSLRFSDFFPRTLTEWFSISFRSGRELCSDTIRYTVIFLICGGENNKSRSYFGDCWTTALADNEYIGLKVKKIVVFVFVFVMVVTMVAGNFGSAAGESFASATQPHTVWTIVKAEYSKIGETQGYYLEWQPGYWGYPSPKVTELENLRGKLLKTCRPEFIQNLANKMVITNQHSSNESAACLAIVEKIVGHKPLAAISESTMKLMRNKSSISPLSHSYLYVKSSGIPLGIGKVILDPKTECGYTSLVSVWWDGSDFIVVDYFQQEIWDILYKNGLSALKEDLHKIQDFCESQNFVTTSAPSWVRLASQNDMFRMDYQGMTIQVHTDSTKCDQFTWFGSSFLVVIPDAKKSLHTFQLPKGDIIVLSYKGKYAYFTVDYDDRIQWIMPVSGKYNFVPAIELTTACEGGLCAIIRTDPDPYVLDGNIPSPQSGATVFK